MRIKPTPLNLKIKRSFFHDYHAPYIYLITVTVVDRKPALCKVEGSVEQPKIVLTEVGMAVKQEIFAIEKSYPQVKVLFNVIIPDHVHIILRVLEQLPKQLPLGNIVAAWKQACGKAYSALIVKHAIGDLKAALPDGQPTTSGHPSSEASFNSQQTKQQESKPHYTPLFSKGFNDSILTGKHQLRHMLAYVKDNPRRLLIKRQYRDLFAIRRGFLVAETKFDTIGNIALLQKPLLAVHCHRKWTEAGQKTYAERCISAAEKDVVLVGAFISKEQKAIEQAVIERHLPIIRLVENGFDELYKPVGQDFNSCAEGRLLLLAPWPYHSNNKKNASNVCS